MTWSMAWRIVLFCAHFFIHLAEFLNCSPNPNRKVCHQEKLALRERLWQSREQLLQQAEFCTDLGAATCTVLWSASRREEAVRDILADVSHLIIKASVSKTELL